MQLRSFLFAGSAFCSLTGAHAAYATEPDARVAAASSSPKADESSVNRSFDEIRLGPSAPLRLRLTEPALPPLPAPAREKLILGMRLPTFIAFGLGGLSAGGAVATSLFAARGNDPKTCDSRCTERGVKERALLLTTGVLTGMAAAGVTIGITLMFNTPKHSSTDTLSPRLALGVSGQKAVAKIGWAFSSF